MDINRAAPVTASAEVLIRAPLDLVWAIQTNIKEWGRWNPDVGNTEIRGPLEPGTEFRWKGGGLRIVSTIREIEPRRRMAWTGHTLGIEAAHVWTFTEREGGVVVRTEESFEGFAVKVLPGMLRRMLMSSLEKWVA